MSLQLPLGPAVAGFFFLTTALMEVSRSMRLIFLSLFLSQGLLAQADCVTPPAVDDSQPSTLESRKKPDKGDPCQTADSNIARSMKNLWQQSQDP
jgi:hypothetical protein